MAVRTWSELPPVIELSFESSVIQGSTALAKARLSFKKAQAGLFEWADCSRGGSIGRRWYRSLPTVLANVSGLRSMTA